MDEMYGDSRQGLYLSSIASLIEKHVPSHKLAIHFRYRAILPLYVDLLSKPNDNQSRTRVLENLNHFFDDCLLYDPSLEKSLLLFFQDIHQRNLYVIDFLPILVTLIQSLKEVPEKKHLIPLLLNHLEDNKSLYTFSPSFLEMLNFLHFFNGNPIPLYKAQAAEREKKSLSRKEKKEKTHKKLVRLVKEDQERKRKEEEKAALTRNSNPPKTIEKKEAVSSGHTYDSPPSCSIKDEISGHTFSCLHPNKEKIKTRAPISLKEEEIPEPVEPPTELKKTKQAFHVTHTVYKLYQEIHTLRPKLDQSQVIQLLMGFGLKVTGGKGSHTKLTLDTNIQIIDSAQKTVLFEMPAFKAHSTMIVVPKWTKDDIPGYMTKLICYLLDDVLGATIETVFKKNEAEKN